jgi:pilus assembly protein TadC
VIVLCVVATMLAVGCIGGARQEPHRRLVELSPKAPPRHAESSRRPSGVITLPVRRLALASVVLVAGLLAIGGAIGVLIGVAGAGVAALVRPKVLAAQVNPDDVPVVVDLIAGCLAAGATLPDALEAAARVAEDVMASACRSVAGALRSGAPPEEAWRGWLADPWLAPVARTAARTSQTGAAAAADLRRTSTRLRARRRAAAQHRLRQASVWLVVPLGLCFLPAFILVAVVPLVIGLLPTLR